MPLCTTIFVVPNVMIIINPHCAHVVFERSTDREWHISSGTSSNGQGDLLEQSCQGVDNSKTRGTLHQQLSFIGTYWCNSKCPMYLLKIVALLPRYTVWCSDCIRERKRENLQGSMNRDTKRYPPGPNWTLCMLTSNKQMTIFSKFADFYISKFRIPLVWCHLTKLWRHLTRVPKFLPCFLFTQTCDKTWIYFVYI